MNKKIIAKELNKIAKLLVSKISFNDIEVFMISDRVKEKLNDPSWKKKCYSQGSLIEYRLERQNPLYPYIEFYVSKFCITDADSRMDYPYRHKTVDGVVKQALNVIKKEIINKEKKESKTPEGKIKAILREDCDIQAIISIKPIQNGYRITLGEYYSGEAYELYENGKLVRSENLEIYQKAADTLYKKMRIKKLIFENIG